MTLTNSAPMEIELKLALLGLEGSDPAELARRIGRIAPLTRRTPQAWTLRNIYFDTPERQLREQRAALRLRRSQAAGESARWLQTLKLAGDSSTALSQRGEWEVPVRAPLPSARALAGTPWRTLDATGGLFAALQPCFETRVQRTTWQIRRRNGSRIEVALDLGQIIAGERRAPICELELELLNGEAQDLFEVAQQIATRLSVFPLASSKAERGHELADGHAHKPQRARPGLPEGELTPERIAGHVLRECFGQFCANLHRLTHADHPELVHQARVGWRRFKSARRLFARILDVSSMPAVDALGPLLALLGEWRDLDVARTETLPPLAVAFAGGDVLRWAQWASLLQVLEGEALARRDQVRLALTQPETGAMLLATTHWLHKPGRSEAAGGATLLLSEDSVGLWARQRLVRLRKRMEEAAQEPQPQLQHRARILAKRLRYGIEELRALLPKRQAERWYAQAVELQTELGQARDLQQALVLAQALQPQGAPVEFLRGVVAARAPADVLRPGQA